MCTHSITTTGSNREGFLQALDKRCEAQVEALAQCLRAQETNPELSCEAKKQELSECSNSKYVFTNTHTHTRTRDV
eukprot:m.190589 g.190589  ORF g.190589 m.190589 type:complete len:76 (+) comp14823_c0_seq1:630-857(+)